MFTALRQSPKKLRLWLLAAGVVLLLASVLEAGHAHGVFNAADDNCILCQHSIALDKILTNTALILTPILAMVFPIRRIEFFIASFKSRAAHIRAPPTQFHAR